jgi:hypothetical protein
MSHIHHSAQNAQNIETRQDTNIQVNVDQRRQTARQYTQTQEEIRHLEILNQCHLGYERLIEKLHQHALNRFTINSISTLQKLRDSHHEQTNIITELIDSLTQSLICQNADKQGQRRTRQRKVRSEPHVQSTSEAMPTYRRRARENSSSPDKDAIIKAALGDLLESLPIPRHQLLKVQTPPSPPRVTETIQEEDTVTEYPEYFIPDTPSWMTHTPYPETIVYLENPVHPHEQYPAYFQEQSRDDQTPQ